MCVGCFSRNLINVGYRRDVVIEPCRDAVSIKCDVTRWGEQVALFELAMARFDAADIVVSSSTPALPDTPLFTETPAQEKTENLTYTVDSERRHQ
jgi:NAD(P)-dependent dehydrogenase (short-subunit alcohol dehydrogenase family)